MKKKISPIVTELLAWYSRHHRILPWRENTDAYRVWISEIMLQQTRVETVIPYYHRFMKRFPDIKALASASSGDLLKIWENLGYYTRARHLQKTAQIIVENHSGVLPDTQDSLLELPGIGTYTAGAILSIAFGKPVPAVDGNVRRVLSRLFACSDPVNRPEAQKKLHALAASLIPETAPGSFNQALMDLGATICTPKSPACTHCPLKRHCRARLLGLQHRLPLSERKPAVPHKQAVAAIVFNRKGQVLVVQRPTHGLLASLWKFPGGFVMPGETLAEGLKRTVKNELGMGLRIGQPLARVRHAYTHFRITLTVFRCSRYSGQPRVLACQDWRWTSPDDFDALTFSKADRTVMKAIRSA
jgi:A/G-specific adenine glycosylase